MNSLQRHRGPDGAGVFEIPEQQVSLGHRRLSILDLSPSASQPMTSGDGRFTVVYNGEIYNFQSLRAELQSHGAMFRSNGDTEVLLQGLQLQGAEFISRLNGIFAFALWDRKERELTMARDPLGVKPLYIAEPGPGQILFASEIKALFAHPGLDRQPNPEAILQHLAFGHACGDLTALKGVRRVPPGYLAHWKSTDRQLQFRRYWKPPFRAERSVSREAAELELREKLSAACRRQLVSDVPVGAFFSGGIDSTLVAALALSGKPREDFKAFTITYPADENRLDRADEDGPYACRAAAALKIDQIQREIKADVATLWPKLIWHLDEPIADAAAIACFLISRIAREERVPVLLSGQGGDELFAGYPRYQAMAAGAWLESFPRPARRLASKVASFLPGAREGRIGASVRRLRRALIAVDQDADHRFLSYCAGTPEDAIAGVLSPWFREALSSRKSSDACMERMNSEGLEGADRWLERDLGVYLPNHNLLYTDKMGMAVGVETRVPLLDLELVETVVRYPVEWKISGGTTKSILRQAARGSIPQEIIDRPKAGFGAPIRKWLRYDLEEMWQDLTSEASVRRRGWFDVGALTRIRELSQAGKQDLYMLQWAVLTIELWARQFIDCNPAQEVLDASNHSKSANG